MNQYFYELQAREKLTQLREEGQRSQAFRRSQPASRSASRTLPGFIAAALSVLVLILVWVG